MIAIAGADLVLPGRVLAGASLILDGNRIAAIESRPTIDPAGATAAVGEAIDRHLRPLLAASPEERRESRYRKFRAMGRFETTTRP